MSFVDVPDAPGVPPVSIDPTAINVTTGVLLTADLVSSSQLGSEQWGIFLGGAQVVSCDNVLDFTFRQDWAIADYPIEGGAFVSYDKVLHPFDARVRFSAGGTEANRSALLQSIASIAGDFNLYDVVTPEAVYVRASISHYDYRRTATNGVGVISVDVWLQEIRETGMSTPGISNPQDPSATSPQATGNVQGAAPTSDQQNLINDFAAFGM